MSEIPEDVMKVAREVFVEFDEDDSRASIKLIASAIMAERERCAKVAEADARRWRALRDFPGACMTLSRNGDHAHNYMTAAEWIERNSEDFEHVEAAEIERMKETDTIWRFQVYPDTPVGFYVWYGATADYVLDAAFQGRNGDE